MQDFHTLIGKDYKDWVTHKVARAYLLFAAVKAISYHEEIASIHVDQLYDSAPDYCEKGHWLLAFGRPTLSPGHAR